MNKNKLKKIFWSNKAKSLYCFIASIIVSIGIPLVVTIVKFDIINQIKQTKTVVRISIISAVIIVTLILIFFKKIYNYLKSLPFSYSICLLKGALKLLPLVLILFLLVSIPKYVTDLTFVTGWLVGCNAIALLGIDPFTQMYVYESKKDEQKEIIKEGVSNAKH